MCCCENCGNCGNRKELTKKKTEKGNYYYSYICPKCKEEKVYTLNGFIKPKKDEDFGKFFHIDLKNFPDFITSEGSKVTDNRIEYCLVPSNF